MCPNSEEFNRCWRDTLYRHSEQKKEESYEKERRRRMGVGYGRYEKDCFYRSYKV